MLSTAKSLETLSFSGCFDENDENLNDFIQFLPNCYNLKKLVVSGSESKKMKHSIQLIFDVLEHFDINILDVSKNAIGDELFVMLSHLIVSNPNVTEFFIDGNNIQTIPAYETFLDQMIQRHTKLVIDMPKQDLLKLSSKNKAVKKTRFSGIVQKFYELAKFPMPVMKSVLRRPEIDQKLPIDGPKSVRSPIILPKISTIEESTFNFNSQRPLQTKADIPVSEIPAPPEKPSEIEYLHHEIQSDDSYEYFYSEDEDPEDGRYDFDRIGKANWDDTEKVFVDDEFWLKNQEQPLTLNTRQTIDTFNKDFTIQNLFSQMR
ncbi:hypothetical protein TVAG_118600 [Trichomonas vaginalis G3]|uniref:Leucine Rich Repeat family protein n=1 Tax=Trichomonas vaginalis (strain ATCC PRA-98 / G3) TaxID=412133 RepID=A2EAW3_TRIV3|nr:leucine-rich repeat, isoform f-related family [Trichomonas vaginalis G3]EAY10208.1 hypothetical protein TVAG_118600 [Trichomonas vaginalis G3]KAI5513992.1 leucine-rich repeat, isoform f-related family [Trichomonas vaginalis G3]|eukprot:XP_001322431.1 hypothetical protein [Trichomonas vaginalis G3]